jgi:hypothetical protein
MQGFRRWQYEDSYLSFAKSKHPIARDQPSLVSEWSGIGERAFLR